MHDCVSEKEKPRKLVEFLVILWCKEMLPKHRRKSCTTADAFYLCRQSNLPFIIALCPSLFHCVYLKSASKCGRQRLPGASALLLPSCAHCVRFAGCFCFLFSFLCQASIKFVLLTVLHLCLPEYQSSASFDILLIFFHAIFSLHAITANKHRTAKSKRRHQLCAKKTKTKDIPLKRSHQINK